MFMDVATLAFYNGKFSFFILLITVTPEGGGGGGGVIRKPQFALLKRLRSS